MFDWLSGYPWYVWFGVSLIVGWMPIVVIGYMGQWVRERYPTLKGGRLDRSIMLIALLGCAIVHMYISGVYHASVGA